MKITTPYLALFTLTLALCTARAADYPVNNTDPSGSGSLAEAFEAILAVSNPNSNDTIAFSALFDSTQTITPDADFVSIQRESAFLTIAPTGLLTIDAGSYSVFNFFGNGDFYVSNVTVLGSNAITISSGASLIVSDFAFDRMTLDAGKVRTSGTFDSAGAINISDGGGTMNVTSGVTTLSGEVSGSGGLTKEGSGELILTNSGNSYNTTTINAGTLTISDAGNLGNQNGQLSLNNDSTLKITQSLTLTQDIQFSGGGAGGNTLLVDPAQTLTISGTILSGGFNKDGDGNLVLSGNNSFTDLHLNAGTISVSTAGNLGDQNGDIYFNGGTLEVDGTFDILTSTHWLSASTIYVPNAADTFTLTGFTNISSGGDLTKTGDGTLILSYDSTVADPGANLNIYGGTVSVNNNNTFGLSHGGRVNFDGGTMATSDSIATDSGMTLLSAGGTFDNSYTFDANGVIDGTGKLTKTNFGPLNLNAANTFSGGLEIRSGDVKANRADVFAGNTLVSGALGTGDITFTGGRLVYGNDASGADYASRIKNSTSPIAVDTGGMSPIWAGDIDSSNTGGLSVSGGSTFTLSGHNAYSGGTTITGLNTALAISSAANLGDGDVTLGDGDGGTLQTSGTFSLDQNFHVQDSGLSFFNVTGDSDVLTLNGDITGSGFTKYGLGTLTLDSTSNSLGTITMTGGLVSIGASDNLGGAALIFNGGGLQVTASMTLNTGSIWNADTVLGSTSGGTIDVVNADDTLTLTGTRTIYDGASLTKTGAGTLILVGASDIQTFNTDLFINGGTVSIDNFNNFGLTTGSINLDGGTLQVTAGMITASETLLGPGGGGLDVANSGDTLELDGTISGDGSLTKKGDGTLDLLGINTYTGGTNLNAGTVIAENDSALGTGLVTFNGGTLRLSPFVTIANTAQLDGDSSMEVTDSDTQATYSGDISGVAGISIIGNGTLSITGTNTYEGTTFLRGGILEAGSADLTTPEGTVLSGALGVGTITFEGGTLRYTLASSNSDYSGRIKNSTEAISVDLGDNDINWAGDIDNTNTGGLSVRGNGTVFTLSGSNFYSGGTRIDGVILAISSAANLGSGDVLFVGGALLATGVFALDQNIVLGDAAPNFIVVSNQEDALTLNGNVFGNSLVKTGFGTLILASTNNFLGSVTMSGGLVSISEAQNLGGASTLIFNGGGLQATGDMTLTAETTWDTDMSAGTSGGTIDVGSGSVLTLTGPATINGGGSLTKTGDGTLDLQGDNTINASDGDLNIFGGTVSIHTANTFGLGTGSLNIDSGTLETTNDLISATITTLGSGGGTFDVASGSLDLEGIITGPGHLTKTGSGLLSLYGVNDYTGGTTLANGTTFAGNNSVFGSGTLTFDGGTLELDADLNITNDAVLSSSGTIKISDSNWETTYGGNISGSGSLTIAGDGATILSGDNTYSGTTYLASGTAQAGRADVFSGDTLVSGSFGTGDITFTGGTLRYTVASAASDYSSRIKNSSDFIKVNTEDNDITWAGNIDSSNTTGIVKTGSGKLTLSGQNTYGGELDINEGTVSASSAANLGGSSISIGDGTLEATGSFELDHNFTVGSSGPDRSNIRVTTGNHVTLNGSVTGGGFNKIGAGKLTLTGTNSLSEIDLNEGTLAAALEDNLGGPTSTLAFQGGIFEATASFNTAIDTIWAANPLGSGDGGTIQVNDSVTLSLSGTKTLFDNSSLTKTGNGVLAITGGSVYRFGGTHDLHINGGTIALGSSDFFGLQGNDELSLDGGTLQATSSFAVGTDITLGNGGGTFDVIDGVSLDLENPIYGPGSLTKKGNGNLGLYGTSEYYGGTNINGGNVTVGNSFALGSGAVTITSGTLLFTAGTSVINQINLAGGTVSQQFASGSSLANVINATSDLGTASPTTATTLDGTLTDDATLSSAFSISSLAVNDTDRLSDVFSFSGLPVVDADTGETDMFVLQLENDNIDADSVLSWLDPNTNLWTNAVYGNFGGTAFFAGDGAYTSADFILGYYGIDTTNHTVWAVLNHNSDFAVVLNPVPEPSTWTLFALGLGAMIFFRLRAVRSRRA